MAKQTGKSGLFSVPEFDPAHPPTEPQFTGRYLVVLAEGGERAAQKAVAKAAGLKNVASAADFRSSEMSLESVAGADGLVLPEIGVMVVAGERGRAATMEAMEVEGVEAREPEQVCYATSLLSERPEIVSNLDYVRGFRDGVSELAERILGGSGEASSDATVQAWGEALLTWGLQATRVPTSRLTGRGVRVAVLDTGMDLRHPDFAQRKITSRSFVLGQTVQDGNGHGTHCIGTSCGPKVPGQQPRYAIGFEADIFAGKVLSNSGSGGDASILAGINWAVANRCQVISMSLGAPVPVGAPFSPVYEVVGRRALAAGTLIIAAAGNESNRPGVVNPVGRPANSPSIMAVAALNDALGIAPFSNGGLNQTGGQVDIAGPGVNIHSSYPMPTRYRRLSGTSMATPHVAGCAALHSQATGARGSALWQVLTSTARRLALASRDVGSGLVQAPQ